MFKKVWQWRYVSINSMTLSWVHSISRSPKRSRNCFSEWGKVKQGVPQGSILRPLFFLLYINDLPGVINDISKPTIFADDTNIIFTHSNLTDFKDQINIVIEKMSNWFQINSLILNFNKTHYIQFMAKSKPEVVAHITYKDNPIDITSCTNFLGLTLDSTLSWKTHINQLSSKLNTACYIIRSLKSVISTRNLRTIYFSYVHSIIAYGIIFWGNSYHSSNNFKLQKRAIRIIMNVDNRVSCHELFKKLNILPLHSQYILSLLLFVVKNIEQFISNSAVHSINTRYRSDLYPPSIKLTKYKKGVYYFGIKIFNHLPQNIKNLSWIVKKFKLALKRFHWMGSLYTLYENFEWISRSDLGTFM